MKNEELISMLTKITDLTNQIRDNMKDIDTIVFFIRQKMFEIEEHYRRLTIELLKRDGETPTE